jgi:hypothetical protein
LWQRERIVIMLKRWICVISVISLHFQSNL